MPRRLGFNDHGILEWIAEAPDVQATVPAVELTRLRFFDPDNASFDSCTLLGTGDETGSTGNADITVSQAASEDPAVGIRFQWQETNGKNGDYSFGVEYNHNSGGWTAVDEWDGTTQTNPFATDVVAMVKSTGGTRYSNAGGTDITTEGSSSQQLGGTPAGTWENGDVEQDNQLNNHIFAKSVHSEDGHVFIIDWANVANTDTIDIRITGADTTTAVSAQITISKVGADLVKVIDEDVNPKENQANAIVTALILNRIEDEACGPDETFVTAQVLNRLLGEACGPDETTPTSQVILRIEDEIENIDHAAEYTKSLLQVISDVLNIDESDAVYVVATELVKVIDETLDFVEGVLRRQLRSQFIKKIVAIGY